MAEFSFKKNSWFSKIESREDALKVIKDTSMAFFVVAILQAVVTFFAGSNLMLDAIVNMGGSFFLKRFNSRVTAIVLLILAALPIGITIANWLGAKIGGDINIFVAIIVFWAGIRAVEATFKFHGRFAKQTILSNE
jgi:hypothetical protein